MTLAWHFYFNKEEMEKTKNSWHNYTFLVSSSLCKEKLFCGYKLLTYPAPPPKKNIYPEESDMLSTCNTNTPSEILKFR